VEIKQYFYSNMCSNLRYNIYTESSSEIFINLAKGNIEIEY